jgi:hypothetical protein
MHFAIPTDEGAKPPCGHDVIDGNLEARGQRIAAAEAGFDTRVSQLQGINDVAHSPALNGHLASPRRQGT